MSIKKGKRGKRIAAALSICMVLGIASTAGCGKSADNSDSTGNETVQTETDAASAASSEQGKQVELKVEVFDRGVQGQLPVDNNYWTQWMQQNFGDPNNIKLTFIPVPRSEETTKLNVLMASNSAPDIVFTYDWNTLYNYYEGGGIADITDLVQEYGPNLTAFLGDNLEYGKIDGKQYALPALSTSPTPTNSYFIRQDWLDLVGASVPTNPDELYDVLTKIKQELGDSVYPYAMSADNDIPVDIVLSFRDGNLTKNEFDAYYGNGKATYFAMPGVKEGFRYLNKLYNEGLISPDFALDKDGTQKDADIVNGVAGAFRYNQYMIYQDKRVYQSLNATNPDARLSIMKPVDSLIASNPFGIFTFIPESSKVKEEAVKFLDWMSQDDVIHFLQYGEEGVHYEMVDGYAQDLPDIPSDKKMNVEANLDYTMLINGLRFDTVDEVIKARSYKMLPEYSEDFYNSVMLSYKDSIKPPFFTIPNKSLLDHQATLAAKDEEMGVKVITAQPDAFDSVYDGLVEEMLSIGGQQVIDENLENLENE